LRQTQIPPARHKPIESQLESQEPRPVELIAEEGSNGIADSAGGVTFRPSIVPSSAHAAELQTVANKRTAQ
jgi:hypothetical protein